MKMDLSHLDQMTLSDEEKFFAVFDQQLEYDDGGEARAVLRSGFPVYYAGQDTPEGCVIKEYPDGCKELVSFMTGTEKLVDVKA